MSAVDDYFEQLDKVQNRKCLECGKPLSGKKGQIRHPACKRKNEGKVVRAKRDKEKLITGPINKNAEILKVVYSVFGERILPIEVLQSHRFNFKALGREIKDGRTETEGLQFGNYSVHLLNSNKQIKIIKHEN
ncbi:MAG: hypothetical protein HN686_14415 [Bacteroidetes bacterium]|jgi:hypothetical protein|nr:hypothetical protein [Bacteroidota bacterium]